MVRAPQIAYDVVLLEFLWALAAAGLAMSAFHAVYADLWPWSFGAQLITAGNTL